MDNLKQNIREQAKKLGIDLVGFASKDRFEGLEARLNPFTIFPEGETVIMVGKRIARGAVRGIEEGSNFVDYTFYGYHWLEDKFLSTMTYDLTRFIEDNGWEAVPVFPNPEQINKQGEPVAPGREAPNVTPGFDFAVVTCGLGEIGMCNNVLTTKYGPRQRFQMIITDAKIEPDPVLKDSICDMCGKCADICPLDAIDKNSKKTVEMCGRKMEVAEVNFSLCAKCQNGAFANRLHPAARPDRYVALCNRTCLNHLEEQKRIENTFRNNFRRRDTWAVDLYGKTVKK